MKKILVIIGLALLALPALAHAQTNASVDVLVFDSSDNYLGACSYTDTATWTQTSSLQVTKIQLWYKWQTGETTLPVTVTKDGAPFATFTATRSACDPYQTSWCNADYAINKDFPAGTYTTKIGTAYQCLKPGGTGVVRLYGTAVAATNTNTGTNANVVVTTNGNVNANTNANRAVVNTTVSNANTQVTAVTTSAAKDTEDEGNGSTLIYVLIGIIALLLIVIVTMYVKCPKQAAQPK